MPSVGSGDEIAHDLCLIDLSRSAPYYEAPRSASQLASDRLPDGLPSRSYTFIGVSTAAEPGMLPKGNDVHGEIVDRRTPSRGSIHSPTAGGVTGTDTARFTP